MIRTSAPTYFEELRCSHVADGGDSLRAISGFSRILRRLFCCWADMCELSEVSELIPASSCSSFSAAANDPARLPNKSFVSRRCSR